MSVLSRNALLVACAAAIIGCASDTAAPSPATTESSRFPMLPNEGGHILSPVRLVVVAAANDSLRDSLFAFAKALPSSEWWPAVATPYGVSPTTTSFTVTGPPIAPGTQMTFADITAFVQAAAIDSAGYAPDGRTVFEIFLPAGVSCGCAAIYTGFHSPFATFNAVAVVLREGAVEPTTLLASHEIIESATDPELNAWILESAGRPWAVSPWGLDDGGISEENADMCEGTRYLESGFYYQRVFSNQAAALGGDPCVPAISTPYFNVTTNGWYSTTTGEVSIPITGWSTGTVPDWAILTAAGPQTASLPAPTITLSCPDSVLANGGRLCGMNNGKTATLHVVLPPGSVSTSWFSIHLFSYTVNANRQLGGGPGQDNYHKWIVGIYVP